MATQNFEPEVGNWYKDEDGLAFEVIQVDRQDGSVQVQHFDGTVDTIDLDSWQEMAIFPTAPPEDWSGPFDDLKTGDLDETELAMKPHDWSDPFDALDVNGFDDE